MTNEEKILNQLWNSWPKEVILDSDFVNEVIIKAMRVYANAKIDNAELPDFLYEDEGEVKTGVWGDTDVTERWNNWKKYLKSQ